MQAVEWVGEDVWFAHAVWVRQDEIHVLANHHCGVAHCPTSNMRLASGIAPVQAYRAAGVNVGLGVDGSASNDGSHLLAEVRNALLVARVKEGLTGYSLSHDPQRTLMTAREALALGTRGGAAVLGRQDVGSLAGGKCADFCAINLNRLGFAGMYYLVAAMVFGQPVNVDHTVVAKVHCQRRTPRHCGCTSVSRKTPQSRATALECIMIADGSTIQFWGLRPSSRHWRVAVQPPPCSQVSRATTWHTMRQCRMPTKPRGHTAPEHDNLTRFTENTYIIGKKREENHNTIMPRIAYTWHGRAPTNGALSLVSPACGVNCTVKWP